MAKFLVTYHGRGEPRPGEMDEAKAAFGKWLAKAGKAVADPGAPVAFVGQVASGTPVAKAEFGGYSIVEADDEAAVLELLRDHPFVARGGTLQVSRAVQL